MTTNRDITRPVPRSARSVRLAPAAAAHAGFGVRLGARAVPGGPLGARGGFNLVEIITVVIVVAILLTLAFTAFGGALGGAQVAQTTSLLRTLNQGIEQFDRDLGYQPPLLTVAGYEYGRYSASTSDEASMQIAASYVMNPPPANSRVTVPEAQDDVPQAMRDARACSEYSLSVYLFGAGDLDGSDSAAVAAGNRPASTADDDGLDGPGIRNPGPDRSWGGARTRALHDATKSGREYGPYLDAAAMEKYLRLDERTGLFRVVDTWGQPVRYYRGWVNRTPGTGEPTVDRVPVELRTAAAVQAHIAGAVDLELDRPVVASPYMLLSSGKPELRDDAGDGVPSYGDMFHTDLENAFDPGSLGAVQQKYLIRSLKKNLRLAP